MASQSLPEADSSHAERLYSARPNDSFENASFGLDDWKQVATLPISNLVYCMSFPTSIGDIEHTLWWSVYHLGYFLDADEETAEKRADEALEQLQQNIRDLPPPSAYDPVAPDAKQMAHLWNDYYQNVAWSVVIFASDRSIGETENAAQVKQKLEAA